jgi:HlyD family secretion protein
VESSVTATGTIEPEEVVDVGAQVAGEIVGFGEDPRDPQKPVSFGTPVEKGTVLARLDASLFKARVGQAKAQLIKSEAEVTQAKAKVRQTERDLQRNKNLRSKGNGIVAPQESDTAISADESSRAALEVARSGVAVAKANLEEAEANLRYTTITSPVKGVILDRRVNIGQTVVANLNAPSLFLIAKDLRRMEIWASVNEADIGSIRVGQPVRFSVGAFPNETFDGRVSQVRLNASMVQNVVTFTVVVSFENSTGKLLPYLTARLDFEVHRRMGVLTAPKAALRWKPKPGDFTGQLALSSTRSLDEGVVWTLSGDSVRPIPVRIGVSDGAVTEVEGQGLTEGTRVVTGVERGETGDDGSTFLPHTKAVEKPEKKP